MKVYITSFLFFFFFYFSFGNSDTATVNQLFKKGLAFQEENKDSIQQYATAILQLSEQFQNANSRALGLILEGKVSFLKTDYNQALEKYNQARAVFEQNTITPKFAFVLDEIGNCYYQKAMYAAAIASYTQALKWREKDKQPIEIAKSYGLIGKTQTTLGNFSNGLLFLFQSLHLYESKADSIGIATTHQLLAINFLEQKNYEKAIAHLHHSATIFKKINYKLGVAQTTNNLGEVYLKTGDLAKAAKLFDKAVELFEEIGNKKGIVAIFKNIAWLNFKEGMLFKARRNCLHALLEYISINDREGEISILLLLGKIEMEDQKIAIAIQYLEEAYQIANNINSKKHIKDISYELFKAFRQKENYKTATNYLLTYTIYKDSLMNSGQLEIIEKLNANYELEKHKNDAIQKTQELQLLQEKEKLGRQKIYTYAGLIGLFLLFIILFTYRLQSKKRKENELLLKDKKLSESQKALLDIELEKEKLEKEKLKTRLDYKNKEIQNFALNIVEKNEFLKSISAEIDALSKKVIEKEVKHQIKDLKFKINNTLSSDKERLEFQTNIEQINEEFFMKLKEQYPDITLAEKRLVALLKMELSTKEIAVVLNISPKSVDMNRYRLRKKFEIKTTTSLTDFINKI